jgi:hypothetical protein
MRAIACVAVVLGTLLCPARLLHAEGTFDLAGTHPDAAVQSTFTGKALAALTTFNGKIYAGFGDYDTNTGPIGIRAFDPVTNTFGARLLNSPTEAVYQFRQIGGKLYAPDIDPIPGSGGYAVGTASGATETWDHRAPVAAVHVFDMAGYGGSLWMSGADGINAAVWRSTDNGATWSVSLSVAPSGGYSFVRIYGMGVYNGKLYANVDAEAANSRVFDGTSWSDGPDLTPDAGFMSNAGTFAGFMVYQSWQCGLGPSKMYRFDGTSPSCISNGSLYDYVYDYKIVGDRMYALVPDYILIPGNASPTLVDIVVKWTNNLLDWQTLATAPITSRSLATLGDQLFLGATNAELYRYSEPIPEPPIIAEVTPDPDSVAVGHPYTRQLTLIQGAAPITWSVLQGPPGTQVSGSGLVSGWQSMSGDAGRTFNFQIQASNADGLSIASWTVRVQYCEADFDRDGDVDQEDFGFLQRCLSGEGVGLSEGCAPADLDVNGGVDQADFSLFRACMAGAGQPPGC